MRSTLRRGLHWVGSALALVGIAFVAWRLHDHQAQIDFSRFDTAVWAAVIGLALIYGAANFFLSLAWWRLLEYFGARTSLRWAIRTYGVSQLAKYVPGNIFQFAGRQAIGMASGLPGWPLAKSTIWELGLIALAGGLYGLLALPLMFVSVPVYVSVWAFVLTVGCAIWIMTRWIGRSVAYAFIFYVFFLAISGGLFVVLVALLANPDFDIDGMLWLSLLGAFVIAWLAGLVTPGAPAGVGVRELVLVFLLKAVVADTDLILAVALGRVVTVAGDVVFFVTALLVKEQKELLKCLKDNK